MGEPESAVETLLSIDSAIATWLNQGVGRWGPADKAAELLVSDYLIPTIMSLALMSTWFLAWDSSDRSANQKGVLTALLGVGFSNLTVLIVNQFYFRERPFVAHDMEMLFYQPTDSSFPANPAAVAVAIAFGVFLYNRTLGLVLGGLAALWVLSRMYSGVFYLTDGLAGAAIGVSITYLFAILMRLIEPLPTTVLSIMRRFHLA